MCVCLAFRGLILGLILNFDYEYEQHVHVQPVKIKMYQCVSSGFWFSPTMQRQAI